MLLRRPELLFAGDKPYHARVSDSADPTASHNKLLLLRTWELDAWELNSLIELTHDRDSRVRDWATFAIAARNDDGEDVRQLLLARTADSDFEARSEAIWGLARRHDPRAVPLLVEALQGEIVGTLFLEAAGYLADPRLIEPLEKMLEWWEDDSDLLAEVIARCRGEVWPAGRIWEFVAANRTFADDGTR